MRSLPRRLLTPALGGALIAAVALLVPFRATAQLEHQEAKALAVQLRARPEREQQTQGRLQAHLKAVAAAAPLAIANAVRVADDVMQSGRSQEALAVYTVPAMSDRMRLADAYPADGALDAPVRLIAAQGEYEPASFVVYPFADFGKSTFTVGELKRADGKTLPATLLDLRVVKVWYQNGNGWISYFMDTGLQLTPELLLHDEDLVKVDTAGKANYARVKNCDGSFRHQWITPPKVLDSIYDERGVNYTFRPMKEDFEDATTLQPVALDAGVFKQFFLTVQVPAATEPGVYTGAIAVAAADKTRLADIPVVLRVLPFALPEPKTYFDPGRDLLVSTYNYVSYDILLAENGGDFELATRQYLGILKNMRRHNIATYKVRGTPGDDLRRQLDLAREAGMRMDVVIGSSMRTGTDTTHEGLLATRRLAQETKDFFLKHLGHVNVYIQSGDEPGPAWIVSMRPHWKIYHELGFKFYTAGHDALYHKGGYIYDMHPAGTFPEDNERTRKWNEIGHAYVGWYAAQHVGVENPAYIRKQYGLVPYRNNFSMLCNYSFAIHPWNDLAKETYKPMVFAYGTRGELVDTLAWEGFREGVDDIRYATLLKQLCLEARDSTGNVDRTYAGRKALQYLADLDVTGGDMNAARLEIIERILQLSAMR
jgi:hypothetical protein